MTSTAEKTTAQPGTLSEYTVRTIDVKRVYRMGNEEIHALKGVNISIQRGEYISIMGPSGSGKSTLFNMIGGLDKPSEGKVYIDEVDIAQLDSYELAWMRCHKIGYIFQTFNLLQGLSVLENVLLGMAFGAGVDRSRARALLARVGLGDRLNHRPGQLSTGQQQRVAVARALANQPRLVLADEPTGNLDPANAREALALIRDVCREQAAALLLVSHDEQTLAGFETVIDIRELNRAPAR